MTLVLPDLVPGHRADILTRTNAMPASQLVGIRVLGFAPGISVIELPIRSDITFDGHYRAGRNCWHAGRLCGGQRHSRRQAGRRSVTCQMLS